MRKDYLLLFFMVALPVNALAASGAKLMKMEVDLSNEAALQRGAKTFVNYCLSCHSAVFMRYNRLGEDLNIPDEVLKANFMFGTDKTGDTMNIAMSKKDALNFFGVVPPDLSVIARARGADWLYTYFKTFYIDESRPFGVNNLAFKDVGMPHVVWKLQGMQRLTRHDSANGQAAPAYQDLEPVTPGAQTEQEYDRTIRDLVNFMVYMGEPIRLKRARIGAWVMLYLFIFLIIAYLLKREYWRDIH